MSALKKLTKMTFAGLAASMLCTSVCAVEPFERDIEIARILNEMHLYSYAEFHINSLLKDNPNEDRLKAQQVDNLLAMKRVDEAMKVASGIPQDSEAYYMAQARIGTYQFKKNEIDAACETMNKIFVFVKTKNDPALTQRFNGTLQTLVVMYNKNGNVQAAVDLRNFLQKQAENAKLTKEQRRNIALDDAKFVLSSIESMQKKEKERTDALEKLIKEKTAAAKQAGKDDVGKLLGEAKATDNPYYGALISTKEADIKAKGAEREKAWLAFATAAGIKPEEIKEYIAYKEIENQQPRRCNFMVKDTDLLNLNEMTYLSRTNPLDWQDATYGAMLKCEDVMWGGLDVLTAYAVAEYYHACYYLEFYDKAFKYMRKYQRLFEDCDRAFAKSELGLSQSPTADAKIWEGYLCESYAEMLENKAKTLKGNSKAQDEDDDEMEKEDAKKPDAKAEETKKATASSTMKEAKKYYRRAFAAFGKYLKNYTKHPLIAQTYPEFIKVGEKVSSLEPNLAAAIQREIAKVPKPEKKAIAGQVEDLVPALAESEYKAGTKLLADIQKLERSGKKVDPKTYAELKKHFRTVITETLPVVSIAKRNSGGLPKVLQYLIFSYGLVIDQPGSEDYLMLYTLSDLGTALYENDDFGGPTITSAQFFAGYAIFATSQKMRNADKSLTPAGLKLKAEAFTIFKQYLDSKALPKEKACDAAIIMARDAFMDADRLGKDMNANKSKYTADEYYELNKKRFALFDKAIKLYRFAQTTFRGDDRPAYQDEIYERIAEAYQLTERYEEAIKINEEFSEKGSKVPLKIVSARNSIVMFLYQLGNIHDGKANDADNELKLMLEPVAPAEPDLKAIDADYAKKIRDLSRQKQASAPVSAPATADTAKAPATAPAAPEKKLTADDLEKERDAAKEKAKADYEADVKKYEEAKAEYDAKKAQLTEQVDSERDLAKKSYERAVKEMNTVLEPMLVSVITGKNMSAQYKDLQAKSPAAFAKDKAEIEKMKVNLDILRPWMYIGAGNLAESAKAFESFIATYENDSTMKAKIPAYYLQLSDIYTRLADEDKTKSVTYSDLAKAKLDILSTKYKDTPQGKNAKFSLFKNLFKRKDYKRAKEALDEVFNNKDLKANLTVSDLRWIISEIGKMESSKGEFNIYVITCCVDLITRLRQKNINAEEWVGKTVALRFMKNKAEFDAFFMSAEESLLMSIAQAYLEMKAYEDAEKSFTQLEKLNPKTGFFYKLYNGRADARIALKKYEKAKSDLRRVSARANISHEMSKYYVAQRKLCDVLEEQAETLTGEDQLKTLEEAYGNYMIFTFPYDADKAPEAVSPDDQGPACFEYALYRSIELSKKFDQRKVAPMKAKYLKYYPNGKYAKQVNAIE